MRGKLKPHETLFTLDVQVKVTGEQQLMEYKSFEQLEHDESLRAGVDNGFVDRCTVHQPGRSVIIYVSNWQLLVSRIKVWLLRGVQ